METLVEFCTNNYHKGTENLKDKLEVHPDYEVMEYECLGHCLKCMTVPFALVEGEYTEASTTDLLEVEIEAVAKEKRDLDELFDQFLE